MREGRPRGGKRRSVLRSYESPLNRSRENQLSSTVGAVTWRTRVYASRTKSPSNRSRHDSLDRICETIIFTPINATLEISGERSTAYTRRGLRAYDNGVRPVTFALSSIKSRLIKYENYSSRCTRAGARTRRGTPGRYANTSTRHSHDNERGRAREGADD